MKWLFFLLLFANIGLLVWIYPQSSAPEPEEKLPDGVENLVLISELAPAASEGSQYALRAVADAGDTENPSKSSLQNTTAAETTISEVVMAGGRDKPDTVKPEVPQVGMTEQVFPDEPEYAPVSEPILHCRTIGPLSKRSDTDKLSLRLRALGVQPEMRSETSEVQEGYWVLIPPQSNRVMAVKTVGRLKEAGITDLWRFTSGKLAHAISLGLFRNQERAETRRKIIAKKGFDVEVRPRFRQKTLYWLGYTYQDSPPLTDKKWLEITADIPNIERRDIDCQEIASQ